MKIAMMVRGFLQTPVQNDVAYSPAIVAQSIAESLTSRGHEVYFYGPEGTDLAVTQVRTCGLRPIINTQADMDEFLSQSDLFETYRPSLYDEYMAKAMLSDAEKESFDCVIFNHFESVLPLAGMFKTVPILHILHDYIDDHRREMLEMFASDNQYFVSISDNQRRDAPDLNYVATIYNGIDTSLFVQDGDPEDYLMISGRITPEKGVKEAIQVAVQTNSRLLISGSLSKSNNWYFDEHIKPYLNNRILFLGMLEREQLVKYYQKASAILLPIQWQEPFGLVMTEAGACGTPTIAFNRGSVAEVIDDGKTGYVVNNSAEMILALEKLSKIKREDCRERVIKQFSTEIMASEYEATIAAITQSKSANTRKNTYLEGTQLREQIRTLSTKFKKGLKK